MKISELIKELQENLDKYGDEEVEIQAYINDVKTMKDRKAFFGLTPYAVDIEEKWIQIYCEDVPWKQ